MSDTEITIPQDVMLDDSRPPQTFERAALYAQIAEKRRAELGIEEASPKTVATEGADDGDGAAPEPREAAPPESPVYLKDGRWVTRRKVNGAEEEVDFDRLLAHDQKLAAADQRLAEASRMRREAEEALSRAQAMAQQPPPEPPADRKALVRQYHQALLDGDDDAADDLLLQINGTASAPPVDLRQIEAVAERRVQQTLEERDRREAVARFKRDFPAVAADDHLWDLADRLTMEVMAEGTHSGLYEIMAEAGRRAIARVTQAAQHLGAKPAQAGSPTPMETRRAAKAAAGRPVAGISATAPAKPEPRPPTASERIAQMQAARRGAVS